MKRFRFSLQPVAVLRAHRELRAQEAFGAALQGCARAEQALELVRRRVADFEAAMVRARQERFAGAAAVHSAAGYARECRAEREAENALAAARQEMEQRRAEYVEAHRGVEVLRRLEGKARQAHRAAEQREEQAGFDEFSGGCAARAAHDVSAMRPDFTP